MGLLQQSLEKLPTQPRGTILARSKFLFLFYLARGREREERERERDSATEDKGAVGLIVRMDSDPSGSPNRGWGANGLSDQIDRYILNYNMQKAVSVFPFLFYREGESERAF